MIYIDQWGQLWKRISLEYVERLSDGNIGGWDNGRGLTRTDLPILKEKL